MPTTENASRHEFEHLVHGPVGDHRLYTDPNIFQLELERVFSTAWIYLGHECQLPEKGSYFLGHIGRVSVIVVRGKDGEINVMENRCAHRGPPVCLQGAGKAKAFVCPYHGWTYRLNGKLQGVPLASDYAKNFRDNGHGLKAAARVDSYRGFIFASLAKDGPDLPAFLGEATIALDDFMDRAPEGVIALSDEVPLRHRFRGNWKIQFENLGDFLHPGFAHASAVGATAEVLQPQATESEKDGILDILPKFDEFAKKLRGLNTVCTEYGHSFTPGFARLSGTSSTTNELLRETLEKKKGKKEAQRIVDTDVWITLIYPSLIIKPGNQNIRIIRPLSHDETEITMQSFRLPGAPQKVFDEAHDYYRSLGSPASPVLSDDLYIYELAQTDYGKGHPLSIHRGYRDDKDPARPGAGDVATSEGYIRNQYRVWSNYMAGAEA